MSTIHVFRAHNGTVFGCCRIDRDSLGVPKKGDLLVTLTDGYTLYEPVVDAFHDSFNYIVETTSTMYRLGQFADLDDTETSISVDYLSPV